MRILVGTLHTIENDFAECCRAIATQSYKPFEHMVIENLPKQEAHEALYGAFMARRQEFDLLVKIDADMIIKDVDFFQKVVDAFHEDKTLDLLLVAVHDYFTDCLLIGVNIFRNTVRWNVGKEKLFTDMTYDRATVRKLRKDFTELAPAASHCGNPSPFEAFHFGFHRGTKAVHGGTNWGVLHGVMRHFRRNPDIRLAYALLGGNAAFQRGFGIQHISYNDKTLLNYFQERYAGMEPAYLLHAARTSRLYFLCNLPFSLRIVPRYFSYKNKLKRTIQRRAEGGQGGLDP